MITFLRGMLMARTTDAVTLDVNGVGYEMFVPSRVFAMLPQEGAEVSLHTYLYVREDAMVLYGFSTLSERALFVRLLKVSGIGPKGALALLSQGTPAELAHAVLMEQRSYFTATPGIGGKTADKLLIELRGSLEQFVQESDTHPKTFGSAAVRPDEAVQALVQLGYSLREAERAVHAVPSVEAETTEHLVRAALRQLSVSVTA